MAKDYGQVKKEVFGRLSKMRKAGDFKGMADYFYDTLTESTIAYESDPENYDHSVYQLQKAACDEYITKLSQGDDELAMAYDEMAKELMKRRVNEGVKLVNGLDKFQKRVENNEIDGIELISNDPKQARKVAVAMSYENNNFSAFKTADNALRGCLGVLMEEDANPNLGSEETMKAAQSEALKNAAPRKRLLMTVLLSVRTRKPLLTSLQKPICKINIRQTSMNISRRTLNTLSSSVRMSLPIQFLLRIMSMKRCRS